MDFIERLFGVSPDGGSGSYEFMLLLVPLMVIAALKLLRHGTSRRGRKTIDR